MSRSIRSFLVVVCSSAFLAACSSGGGGGGAIAFAGTIQGPGGTGLQGAIVEVIGVASTKQAVTDADGNFLVQQPPTGLVGLHVDGSNVAGGNFASLHLQVTIGGGTTNLSQPVVLPDLAAGATMSVPVDANGQTMGEMTVTAPDGSALTIPDMTTILVDGAIPAGTVDVNVTAVPAIEVPMPLPGTQDPGAFVTIQPPGAAFTPALDIKLPNTRGFPLGTVVDIWSFDHGLGMWVNRSEETGNQGTVVDEGGMEFIVASAVITEGGWHAGTLPVDLACATIIEGQVFEEGTTTPVADVLISLSTGQFARTDAAGRFRITAVPAYDASMLPKVCVADDVELRAIAPVAFGAQSVTLNIGAGTVVTGGTTALGTIEVPVLHKGSLVGSVTNNGQGVEGTVSITGTATLTADSDENGSFFVASLDPGPYTATFTFPSGPDTENFTITANRTTSISLRAGAAPGGGALDVEVLDFSESLSGIPVADACVTVQGGGGTAVFATTAANGIATFASTPGGPYTITAQKDTTIPSGILRIGATIVGVTTTVTPRKFVVPFFIDDEIATPLTADATLDGMLLNAPANADFEIRVETETGNGFLSVNPVAGGAFSVQVPSNVPLDVAVKATDQVTGGILSAVLVPGVVLTTGQTLTQDVDFANACLFDQAVTANYTNVLTPHTAVFADLELRGSGNVDFSFADGLANLPSNYSWPDLSAAKLNVFDAFFEVGAEDTSLTFAESFCDRFLSIATPAVLNVNFLGVPTIQAPANQAVFPAYGTGSMVQFTPGSGNGQTAGFNNVTFFGDTKAGLTVFWDILAPPTANKVTLPVVFAGKPMFLNPGFYVVNVEIARFVFPGFDFPTFFDEDLPNKIAAVTNSEICGGDRSHFFFLGAPGLTAGPTLADRARLHERARAGGLFGR